MSPPMPASRPLGDRLRGARSGAVMAIGSMSCVQLGLALSAHLLDQLRPPGIARIPPGTASALEFLGPLTVSVLGPGGGRRRWAVLAAAGVVLLTRPWNGGIDPAGLGFALGAAACWGTYILLTQHVGDRVTGLSGLAVSIP